MQHVVLEKGGRDLRAHLTLGQVLGRVVEEAGLGVEDELVIFPVRNPWSPYPQGDPWPLLLLPVGCCRTESTKIPATSLCANPLLIWLQHAQI